MFVRAMAVWLVIMVIAIANGGFREAILVPRLGSAMAHIVSTAVLCAAIAALTLTTIGWVRPRNTWEANAVGVLWLALVLAFEFGFGHFIAHNPWSELLADYNVFRGRIWVVVPVITAFAPYVAVRRRLL